MQIDTLTTLTKVLAHVYGRFVIKKPGVTDLVGLALADGIEIKRIIDNLHDIPSEVLDLDTEESQYLSSVFTHELDGQEDKTIADEVFGRFLILIPHVKGALASYKEKDVEGMIDALYTISKMVLSIYSEFKK